MRCSFHITHLKGYNYHKHLTPLKITGKSLLLHQQKGSAFTQAWEKATYDVEKSLILVKEPSDYLELHRHFLDPFCRRHYGTLTNFHLSSHVTVGCFNPFSAQTHKSIPKMTFWINSLYIT